MLALCFCYKKATQVSVQHCSHAQVICAKWTPPLHDAVDSVCTVFDNAFKLLSNYLGHLSPKASSSYIADIWANMKISSPKASDWGNQ